MTVWQPANPKLKLVTTRSQQPRCFVYKQRNRCIISKMSLIVTSQAPNARCR